MPPAKHNTDSFNMKSMWKNTYIHRLQHKFLLKVPEETEKNIKETSFEKINFRIKVFMAKGHLNINQNK